VGQLWKGGAIASTGVQLASPSAVRSPIRGRVAHECRFAEREKRLRGITRGWAIFVGDRVGIGADVPELPVFSVLAGNTNSERQAEKDR
jgi:hypothetical protein